MKLDDLKKNINEINELKSILGINGFTTIESTETEKRYVIVRTYSAGVHAGTIVSHDGKQVTLENARRIWYWEGAASLSQMAMDGVSSPDDCKFSVPVNKIILSEAIEIIDTTDKAEKNIKSVKEWKQ